MDNCRCADYTHADTCRNGYTNSHDNADFDTDSHTQDEGIAKVNQVVAQLDTLTQQNAALAEESAASAEMLQSGALGLHRSVDVFHTR